MRITMDLAGDVQLDRQLARLSGRTVRARPAFEAMADLVAAENLRQFTSQGRYASGGWSPLSPAYARSKGRRFPGRPIMVRTGRIRRDLTRRPFGVEIITETGMTVGTTAKYAAAHQRGNPGGNLPQRRLLELREATRRQLIKQLQRFIITGQV